MAVRYDDVFSSDMEYSERALPPQLTELNAEMDERDVDEERQGLVQRMIEEAIDWRLEDLDHEQAKATDYYHGRDFGNEEEGRSKVVMTTVKDSVKKIIPSLMRIFWGPEKPVEYRPTGPEDVRNAEQATDYVRHIVTEDNPGFVVFHSAFKDALVRKMGIVKWWWEEKEEVETKQMTGLGRAELLALELEEEVDYEIDEVYGGESEEEERFDITVTRRISAGIPRIAEVPNEEFIFSPGARSRDDAALVGHVRMAPAHELIAMGIDEELVEDSKSFGYSKIGGELAEARRFDEREVQQLDERDPSTEKVLYCEVYVMLASTETDWEWDEDLEEDVEVARPAELRKICTIGDAFTIVTDEPADERPFAIYCPDPEPHTFVGSSVADSTMDLQLITSAIVRGQLDSLNQTLNPREAVAIGKVNMQDVLNREVGAVIRCYGDPNNVIREIATPFLGKEAFPMLEFMDNTREERLGITKASEGLDADALQSSTKMAVAATLSAAQQQIEMIARIFAETGMKDLFRGLLKMICEHQDQRRMVRLRNEYVWIDPRSWNAGMDVQVNVALGAGLTEDRLRSLGLIIAEQKEHIAQGSPLVSLAGYRRTLARYVELAGWPNPDEFFEPFGEKEQEQYSAAMSQQQQQPDPAMALVQVEAEKAQIEAQVKMAELELKKWEARMKDDRERDKMAREAALKERELELKHKAEIQDSALRAAVERDRAAMDADVKRQAAQTSVTGE